MAKWLLVVRTNCIDESKEDEFNKWYNEVHVPDVMEVAGFVKAGRYVSPEMASYDNGKYLAIYEIETEDINKTMELLGKKLVDVFKQGRTSDFIRPVSFGLFKPIRSFTK